MGLFSDLFGSRSKDRAKAAAANAALGNYSLRGPGGMSVGFTPTSGNVALGALDPIRAMLLNSIGPQLGSGGLGISGLASAADEASSALAAQGIDPDFIRMLQGLVGSQVGTGAAPSFGPTGLDPRLLEGISSAALARLGDAGADPDALANERLALLREQAQPFEQDFIRQNIEGLFSRGRFGMNDSLSGRVSEGVARALSEADINRQITAAEFGRQRQNDALSAAMGLTGTADSLLGNEFSRILSGFQAGQEGANAEVGRMTSLASLIPGMTGVNQSAALSRFDIARQLFGAMQEGETNAVNRGLATLGGVSTIDSAGLQQFMAALQAATARSNAAANQATIFNDIAKNNPGLDFLSSIITSFA